MLEEIEDEKYVHGFINSKGEVIVPIIYDKVKDFDDGIALVEKDGEYGFIDKTGKIVVPLKYHNANYFNG